MLNDQNILREMVNAAGIAEEDVVLELGVGTGSLTELLCLKAKSVVGYELDKELSQRAGERLAFHKNLFLGQGDGLKTKRHFDVFVSNIPYSQSRRIMEWLAARRFKRAVVTVQTEFAEKILASHGSKNYVAVSALVQGRFKVSVLRKVHRESFTPPPRVSSTILVLEPFGNPLPKAVTLGLKKLFSFRGRTVSAMLKRLEKAESLSGGLRGRVEQGLMPRRVEGLSPAECIALALHIIRRDD